MSYVMRNGSPINAKKGMQDNSVPELVRAAIGDPIHKPLIFTYAARCVEDEAFPLSGDNALDLLGRNVFDFRGPYATFNTPYMAMFNANGNEMMVQVVRADDATLGYQRLVAEVVAQKVPQWERDAKGAVVYDENGPKKKADIDGIVIIFRYVDIPADGAGIGPLFAGKVIEGQLTGTDGAKSKIYPMWDIEGPYRGKEVNGFGHKLVPLNAKSSPAMDPRVQNGVGGRLYAMQWFETLEGVTSPVIWKTLTGMNSINVSFKPGAYYQPLRTDYDFENVVADAYRKESPDVGGLPHFGPFKKFHFYHENYKTILELAAAAIKATPAVDPYMVDIFGGLDLNGEPYDGLAVNPASASDKAVFSGRAIHYLRGGSDGTMSDANYDELVRREMLGFPNKGMVKYENELKYSLGTFHDSGFSYDTKEALVNFIGKSQNTFLFLTTHAFDQGQNDMQAEESAKVALIEMVQSVPESALFGTPVARACITGQSGFIRNSSWKKPVPFGYSLANLFSRYAGQKDGRYKPEYRFNRGSKTVIEDLERVTMPWKGNEVYASDWDVSLVTCRSYDYYRLFIPAVQSVYPEERSVLNNALFNFTMAYVYRVTDRVWANTTGEDRMTRDELAKDVENQLIEELEGRLDGVANITPKAYFTPEDIANGYSISVDLRCEGSVLLTQFNTTIRVFRREA